MIRAFTLVYGKELGGFGLRWLKSGIRPSIFSRKADKTC